MEVDDVERRMECRGPLRGNVRPRPVNPIQPPLGQRDEPATRDARPDPRRRAGRGDRQNANRSPRAGQTVAVRGVGALRTSSRKPRERASRSRTYRTNSRIAASISRSAAGARRSAAIASISSR